VIASVQVCVMTRDSEGGGGCSERERAQKRSNSKEHLEFLEKMQGAW